jgi:hypothetical protein
MGSGVTRIDASSRWGVLPVALALALIVIVRVGALTRGGSPSPRDAGVRGAVLTLAAIVTGVRILGAIGQLTQVTLFLGLLASAVVLLVVRRDLRLGFSWRGLATRETAPVVAIAAGAMVLCTVAAYLLPVWQWDALGYHLPYVNFGLQRGTLADVPIDVPYLATYPHVVEHFFLAWRAMLADDRLVDAAQIPLGLLGAAAVAAIAHQAGARRDHAVAAGLLWLMLPAVFLQLPTNYIDVGVAAALLTSAALVLAEPTVPNVICAGVALGLFLGAKPNAPIGAALLVAVLAVRGWKAGRRESLLAAGACILLVGGESYLHNIARHGNPIWPVSLSFGPFKLPGGLPMSALLESGCAAPRVDGPLWLRIARSWTTIDAPPVFDMRYGGLGLVFLAAAPLAIVVAVRRRSWVIAVVVAATLASPDPAVGRYILAFPGIVLALAASRVSLFGPRARLAVFAGAVLATGFGLVRAYPGLVGEGPPLGVFARMTERERLRAVGADGSPAPFYDALERVGPGETTAFDTSFELPYLAWPPDLSSRAVRIPDNANADAVHRLVEDPNVRLFVVDTGSAVAKEAREHADRFTELFHCRPRVPPSCVGVDLKSPTYKSSSCVVLLRL